MPNTTDSDSCDSISRRAAAAWYNWIKLSSLSVTRCEEEWPFRPCAHILWKRAELFSTVSDTSALIDSKARFFDREKLFCCKPHRSLNVWGTSRLSSHSPSYSILTHSHLTLSNIKENSSLNFSTWASHERRERERAQRKKKEKRFSFENKEKSDEEKPCIAFSAVYVRRRERESKESNSTRKKYAFRHAYLDSSNKLPKKSRAKAKTKRKIRRAKVFFSFFSFFFLSLIFQRQRHWHTTAAAKRKSREKGERKVLTPMQKRLLELNLQSGGFDRKITALMCQSSMTSSDLFFFLFYARSGAAVVPYMRSDRHTKTMTCVT